MLQVLKAVIRFETISSPFASFGKRSVALRFQQVKFAATNSGTEEGKMSNTQNQSKKTGDVMSNSFGEGYSTRSEEDGFGYSGNQRLPNKSEEAQVAHESHPDYDKTQGSDVKEKENARNQHKAS